MAKTATAPAAVPTPEPAGPPAKFELVDLDRLVESPSNHRKKTWGEMDELVDSIRAKGVLQPILVRPVAGNSHDLEIVFGHRRARAAKKAGLSEIPAVVRELSDVEAVEANVIENLQRADVHPLEEAEGLEQLLASKEKPYTVEDLAAKVGKSKAYVYGRLKLTALCPDARKAFYAGAFSASVALLVARMPADLQTRALKELERYGTEDDPVSFRQAVELIHRGFMLDLKGASFDPADAGLVPSAGACSSCPKRSGANPDLFGDVESGDVCSDPTCFRAKTDAAWKVKAAAAKAAGRQVLPDAEAKKVFQQYGGAEPRYDSDYVSLDGACTRDPKYRSWRKLLGKHAAEAVVLAKDHEGNVRELLPKTATAKLLREAGHNFKAERQASASPGYKEDHAKWREQNAIDLEVGRRTLAAFGDALDRKEPGREVWEPLLDYALDGMVADEEADVLARRFSPLDPGLARKAFEKARPKMEPKQLRAVALELLLSQHVGAYRSPASKGLLAWAGVDVKAIEAEVKAARKRAAEPIVGVAAAVKAERAARKKGKGAARA